MRGIAGVTAAALLLAGCGGTANDPPAGGRPVHTPTASPSATSTDGNGSLVPKNLQIPSGAGSAPTLVGADVSWPQCPKGMGIPQKRSEGAPMPTAQARFVIIGLTNGPSFVANPCLADQVAWARARHLRMAAYSVVSYPDASTLKALGHKGPYDGATRLGALGNVGYQAALFNIDSMRRVGLLVPTVWVDVEPVVHFDWSSDTEANAAVVRGTVRGYEDAGLRVGFYSVKSLWQRVVGGLRMRRPEWRAAGKTSAAEALRRCNSADWSFNGGSGVIGQWVAEGRDLDVTCPGMDADLAKWFRK